MSYYLYDCVGSEAVVLTTVILNTSCVKPKQSKNLYLTIFKLPPDRTISKFTVHNHNQYVVQVTNLTVNINLTVTLLSDRVTLFSCDLGQNKSFVISD